MTVTTEHVITDPALVPAAVVTKDKALQETIKVTQKELDQHRWEATTCTQNQEKAGTLAYAKAVGVDHVHIQASIDAWKAHEKGCTDPSHVGGKAITEAEMPSDAEHAHARAAARGKVSNAAASKAYANAAGKTAASVEKNDQVKVKQVHVAAIEVAAELGQEEVGDAAYEIAAARVAQVEKDMATRKQKVKVAMMEARGLVDFKLISDEEIDKVLEGIEAIIKGSAAAVELTGKGVAKTWDEACAEAIADYKHVHEHVKAEANKKRKQAELVKAMGTTLSDVYRRSGDLPLLAAKFEELGISQALKDGYLHNLDVIMADVMRAKEILARIQSDEEISAAIDAGLADIFTE